MPWQECRKMDEWLRFVARSRGIIKESTGCARDRVYVYRRYLKALAAEEEARVSAAGAS